MPGALSIALAVSLAAASPRHLAKQDEGGPQPYCARISEIQILPSKHERVKDEVYNALRHFGASALPCLIAKVTDESPMPDPRQSMKIDSVAVGDVAVFLVWDLGHVPEQEIVPPALRKDYATRGVNAYFAYVEDPGHRKEMQRYLRSWLSHRHKSGN
jgi:hypothetical protein